MKKEQYLSLIDEVIAQGPYTDTWDSLCEHPTPKWYARDKFGIFIHWGVYSVPAFGNEWYPRNMYLKGSKENLHHTEKYGTLDKFGYKDFIPQFKAEKFDPKEWAALFKEAGAKFVVPVAEHHDGFQMYASDLCRWNAAEMGPKRDILGELKTEVEKEGMVLGASSHRAEHYWFFNGGRQIPEADVNDPEYADLYGPVAGITRDMSDIYDMREYIPGDNIRRVHWKLSSKLDNMVIRDGSDTSYYDTILLLDIGLNNQEKAYEKELLSTAYETGMAVSRSLLLIGIQHCLCISQQSGVSVFELTNESGYLNMQEEMLQMPIPNQNGMGFYYAISQDIENKYTKLIYLTVGECRQELLQIGGKMDVTVISIAEGDGEIRMTEEGRSQIIELPVQHMNYHTHSISI